jgi:FkbM family methyltransferase
MLKFNPMKLRIPVLKRLVPSIRKRLAQITWPDGFAIVRSRGARFLVNYHNYVDRQIAFYDDFESQQLEYLLENIRRYGCTNFIDIGANIGFYTIHVAIETSISRLSAFEPDPRNFHQLRANLFLSALSTRVEVHGVAISDRVGKIAFKTYPDTGQSHVVEGGGDTQIDAVRLDDVLILEGAALAIKIDIEGHEIAAVDGMRALLATNNCLIQAEVYPPNLGRFRAALTDLGYREIHAIGHDYYFTNFHSTGFQSL